MYSMRRKKCFFPSAREEAKAAPAEPETPQAASPSFTLAYEDNEFVMRDELRSVRLQLELLKPELIQHEHDIESTVVLFGSARTPDPETAMARLREVEKEVRESGDDAGEKKLKSARKDLEMSRYYAEARELGRLISSFTEKDKLVVVSGGGPGIMEAANRGAADVGAQSIGLNIVLPHEQSPNPYITPELCFQFHYFAIRKMHFLMRARALVAFPGGFGTMDELFETLTLIQTRKVNRIPVLLFGKSFWERIVDFDALVEEKVISPEDLGLFEYVETADEAWKCIAKACGLER